MRRLSERASFFEGLTIRLRRVTTPLWSAVAAVCLGGKVVFRGLSWIVGRCAMWFVRPGLFMVHIVASAVINGTVAYIVANKILSEYVVATAAIGT